MRRRRLATRRACLIISFACCIVLRFNGEGGNSAGPDAGGDAFVIVPEGEDAVENGFESWCHFKELDYADTFHPFTHGHVPDAVPSNVQVQ